MLCEVGKKRGGVNSEINQTEVYNGNDNDRRLSSDTSRLDIRRKMKSNTENGQKIRMLSISQCDKKYDHGTPLDLNLQI